MTVERTAIPDLLVVRSPTHEDHRGFFRETGRLPELARALGREPRFVQGNHARSRRGVLRGFHAEPWDKLVQVVRGTAFCAIADLRVSSPTCGRVATFLVGDEPGERVALFIAEGLANAYQALDEVDYLYQVTQTWDPSLVRRSVAWDDPDLGVAWPVLPPIVSAADDRAPSLAAVLGRRH